MTAVKAGIVEIDKATALHPRTDREQRYVAALSSYLHAHPSQNERAAHAYADAMGALHTAYPDDVEAQAFHGLALAACIGQEIRSAVPAKLSQCSNQALRRIRTIPARALHHSHLR
jgi:hypothetical protein